MTTKPDPFHMLLGRALVDEKYRRKLLRLSSRKAALKDLGIANPTQEQLDALQSAITAFGALSSSFEEETGAA
jgi:hypothetical protein